MRHTIGIPSAYHRKKYKVEEKITKTNFEFFFSMYVNKNNKIKNLNLFSMVCQWYANGMPHGMPLGL